MQNTAVAAGAAIKRKGAASASDRVFRWASLASAVLVLLVLAGILGAMVQGGWPAFQRFGFSFLTSSAWDIGREQFGAYVAVVGTLVTATIAVVIGVPVSLGIAVFVTQLCPPWAKTPIATTVELLAAVPSIIYGMWGLFVLAPIVQATVQEPLSNWFDGVPVLETFLTANGPAGTSLFTAGIILAVMIVPFIASIARDILDQIPTVLRESAYGMGCTTWEVLWHVLIPQARVSLVGAVMLGLGRALGETMAVTFVVGNSNRLSLSVLDPGSTIASRIASEFNEASGLQLSALLALGCILFVVTFLVLVAARLLVGRPRRA